MLLASCQNLTIIIDSHLNLPDPCWSTRKNYCAVACLRPRRPPGSQRRRWNCTKDRSEIWPAQQNAVARFSLDDARSRKALSGFAICGCGFCGMDRRRDRGRCFWIGTALLDISGSRDRRPEPQATLRNLLNSSETHIHKFVHSKLVSLYIDA
jgi:hypothetical protein